MKYTVSFKEVNYGSIEIESSCTPTRAEVIEAIESGNAYFKNTEYEDIHLEATEHQAPKKERSHER